MNSISMANKDLITDNPYRRLGIYVGDPVKTEVRNLNRITAFSRVGQTATFDMRCDDLLPVPAVRTEESAKSAANALSLPRERLRHALMWLGDEDTEWGRTLSGAVTALIREDYTAAIRHYDILTSRDDLREEMIKAATHGLLALTKSEMIKMVADLITEYSDNLHAFWQDGQTKPSCLLTQLLWQKKGDRVSNLINSLKEYKTPNTDIYQEIDMYNATLNTLAPWCVACREVWEPDSTVYQTFATDVAEGVYNAAALLIRRIGELTWRQKRHPEDYHITYSVYDSGMSTRYVKACMGLIIKVWRVTENFITELQLNDDSRLVLEEKEAKYSMAVSNEYVDDEDDEMIKLSLRRYRVRKAVELTIWGMVAVFIFFNCSG